MRLLNTATFRPEEFVSTEGVKYAILSHRWEDEEVSLQQLVVGDVHGKLGYVKIQRFCGLAAKDGYEWAWVDTCCIDKSSSAELQEAINSMYRWYQEAALCYIYLSDVKSVEDLGKSAWFTRGWTLQEMIAPDNATFYNWQWEPMGTKTSLAEVLSKISGVPTGILKGLVEYGSRPRLDEWSVAQRMSWASKRVTTWTEDTAYSLMGLFDVNMPMLYGEGHKAFRRLQEEIIRTSDDQSIFAWSCGGDGPRDLLASSPAYFAGCATIFTGMNLLELGYSLEQFSLTNVGLSISLPIQRWDMNTYLALLDCDVRGHSVGIFLAPTKQTGQFVRSSSSGLDICHGIEHNYIFEISNPESQRIMIIPGPDSRHFFNPPFQVLHGFDFLLTSNPLFRVTTNGKARFRLSGYASLKKELFDNQPVLRATFADGPQWVKMDFMIPENTGPIGRIFFGFSFDLRPVCLLVGRAQASADLGEEHRGQIGTHKWIEKKIALHRVQVTNAGGWKPPFLVVKEPIDSYCALHGQHRTGLSARIPHPQYSHRNNPLECLDNEGGGMSHLDCSHIAPELASIFRVTGTVWTRFDISILTTQE
ncbi:hypothetical protein LTR96_000173 [Exophiala xenobiotica]|nr:hypothetical protein LTR96_000173 [Exophiala xenobiotica]KAK5338210.1 hypothetical protein LTR98_006059 [Exophiala xenobiotica]